MKRSRDLGEESLKRRLPGGAAGLFPFKAQFLPVHGLSP
jgi:hypothetical protein